MEGRAQQHYAHPVSLPLFSRHWKLSAAVLLNASEVSYTTPEPEHALARLPLLLSNTTLEKGH